MKSRCTNPNHEQWKRYGGRGITVCERWLTFDNFLADMGEAPKRMTLERKHNNGNYEPSNCVWASAAAQARNRRDTVLTEDLVREIHGRTEYGERITSIARRMGISSSTVSQVRSGKLWRGVV
jgi:hypothetical protein